jgi:hypothetical protein
MRSLTWTGVWARRVTRSGLLTPWPAERIGEAAGALCGVHAQMMSAAELSLGIRVAGVTRQDVRAALWEQRSLVKTYGIRGTVHLFPASEVALWTAALRENSEPLDEKRLERQGLSLAQARAIIAAIGDALDGRTLTREELGQEVARRVGAWALDAVSPAFGGQWPRWQMMIGAAANAGLLLFGPNRGAKVTFARPERWLAGWTLVDGRAALSEVFRRYLATYGPATSDNFAQWFGAPPARGRALTRDLADELEAVDIEGHQAWQLASEPAATASDAARDGVWLLPHFDCYEIACHPRQQLVPAEQRERVLPHGGAGNVPVVIVGGVVAGVWSQRRSGRRLDVRVETFEPLRASQHRALEAAVARIGEISEAQATLTLGTVETRPHL